MMPQFQAESQVRTGLYAGGRWIRTLGPPVRGSFRARDHGRVQGVDYQLWTTRTAASLGLRGGVRNRSDASVEGLVTGAPVTEGRTAPSQDDGSLGSIQW